MKKLTHTTKKGKASMVDVGAKPDQHRVAIATGHINLHPETIALVRQNLVKKGDVKRAKLYYLKTKIGKETKVEEKVEHEGSSGPREGSK